MDKICLVGAGNWGQNYIPILFKRNVLSAIVEKDINIIKRLKSNFPKVEFYNNFSKVPLEKYNGYIVATPANTHYKITKEIIKHNKHVLIEKPMTISLSESKEIYDLSLEKNVNVMVGHVLLFHPAFIKIKQLINEGIIGKIQYLYSNRLNLGKIRTHENVFWSFAPHDIALFQYFINNAPKEINSEGICHVQSGIHDTTITTIKYPNNIMGHIFVSWLHPFKEHRFVVVGSKGMISFEDSNKKKPLLFYDKTISWKNNIPIPKNGEITKIKYDSSMPLDNQVDYFINHLDGKKIKISNAKHGLEVMEILSKSTEKLNRD